MAPKKKNSIFINILAMNDLKYSIYIGIQKFEIREF